MSDDYTPDTEEVRTSYRVATGYSDSGRPGATAEFDRHERWQQLMRDHEAEVKRAEEAEDARKALTDAVRAEADAYSEQPDMMEPCGAVAQALRAILDQHGAGS